MLTLIGFEKKYSDLLILRVDNLKLVPGIYWIKGQNGSGKSTLFKSISGLIPFTGEIALDRISLKNEPVAYRKTVNFSEAEPLYPGFLTAKDLIQFVGKTKGASADHISSITEYFGVDSYLHKSCETFSSGMLKKLSLTLAFLGNPKLIILDEPLITLDEQTRLKLVDLVKNYLKKETMFLVSSHQTIDDQLDMVGVYEIKNQSLHRV
jgi:ABC-2 type transport system ATP-binding protein